MSGQLTPSSIAFLDRSPSEPGSDHHLHAKAEQLQTRGVKILRQYGLWTAPRLSIVIPVFNTEPWIEAAIHSALNQTETAVEVVVVNDGSTDGSLARALAFVDERLTVITQPNQGLSAARNSGIFVARAPLIGFLDSDDVWFPEKAERHLALHQQSPEIGLTFSWSAYLDEAGTKTGQFLITHCDQPDAKALARRNHVGNGSTAVVERRCFEEVGLFDESLPSCEDLDMWIRIASGTSRQLRLIPELLTGYRVREGSLSLTFGTFVQAAETLQQRLANSMAGLDKVDGDRCLAQLLRITSRKALADGQVSLSRKLLVRAIKAHPATVLTDTRGLVLVVIHLGTGWLPARTAYALYRWVARLAGIVVSMLLGLKARHHPVSAA